MLEIEIDGQSVQVAEGSTVMEAAQQIGAYIPHFCYHKKLSIAANCRMCLVQVEKAPKPLPACATPVTSGMKVFTHSDLAVKAQRGVMEFLLINHPLDCPICDQGGECQLQDLAVGYGGSVSRYQEEKRVVFHKDVGPLISMQEMSRCIHCTRCVRFGQEVAGIMEFGMVNRNMHSEITTFVGRSVDSELSGNMIDLCPVGALTSKPFRYSARSWELQRRKLISPHDGLGTNLFVQVKHDRVMRVLPSENEAINECWISDKDRFAYEALNTSARLQKPMIRIDGALREVTWNVALDYVAHGIKDIVREQGASALGFLASPHSSLEELYLLQKLAAGLGCPNIDFRLRHRDFSLDAYRAGIPWLGLKIADIQNLDAVLVVGSFIRKEQPLLAQRLRQIAKQGAQVSFLGVGADNPLLKSHAQITVSPSDLPVALAAIVKAAAQLKGCAVPPGLESLLPCSESQAVAKSLLAGERTAVFMGNVAEHSMVASQLHILAQELSNIVGASLGFLGEAANSVGGYVAGAVPAQGGLNAYSMLAEPRRAYVVLGAELEMDSHNAQQALRALQQAALRVVLTPFKDGAMADYADALLPIAPFTETSGTFVNTEGRAQSFQGVVRPQGEVRPAWKVLRVLANLLDLSGFDYLSSESVRDDVLAPDTEFASGLDNTLTYREIALPTRPADGLQRVADIPIYSADSLVRRAPALQATRDAQEPTVRMAKGTLAELGLSSGSAVRVTQGDGIAVLIAQEDDTVPRGCARIAGAHRSTMTLGDLFGTITVERL